MEYLIFIFTFIGGLIFFLNQPSGRENNKQFRVSNATSYKKMSLHERIKTLHSMKTETVFSNKKQQNQTLSQDVELLLNIFTLLYVLEKDSSQKESYLSEYSFAANSLLKEHDEIKNGLHIDRFRTAFRIESEIKKQIRMRVCDLENKGILTEQQLKDFINSIT